MGVIYKDGILYGNKTQIIELTKAQYDALTPAQKSDITKMYFITDYDPSGEGLIDDTTTASYKTWSSSKISEELNNISITTKVGTDTVLGGQFIVINNTETLIVGTGWMEKTQTLSTSENNVFTFTNAAITENSVIDPYTNIYDMYPSDIQLSNGQCQVIFDPYESAVSMSCKIYIK